MTYTVYDFVNNDISGKHMRLGWKVETDNGAIVLRYTMLNFDWDSLRFVGNDLWNMFLSSSSYASYKKRLSNAMKKHGRLYVHAYSIADLKTLAKHFKIEVDIDKIIAKKIMKKSELTKEKCKSKVL